MRAPKILTQDSCSSGEDEWETVPRRQKPHSEHTYEYLMVKYESVDTVPVEAVREWITKVEDLRDRLGVILNEEKFWERYRDQFHGVKHLAAYGVGSFVTSKASLFQFCFLLILKDELGIENNVAFYEPQLFQLDKLVLHEFQMECNPHRVTHEGGTTLCFMPHCDRSVYGGVLRDLVLTNRRFLLISNIFEAYETESDDWRRVNQLLTCVPMFIWDRDYRKYLLTEGQNRNRFKAKAAQSSDVVPYQAFNDLAFVSYKEADLNALTQFLAAIGDSWSILAPL